MATRVEEAGLDGEGAEKTPAALLLHFPASACPMEVERGGASRVQ
jgi:hypothetical protein